MIAFNFDSNKALESAKACHVGWAAIKYIPRCRCCFQSFTFQTALWMFFYKPFAFFEISAPEIL